MTDEKMPRRCHGCDAVAPLRFCEYRPHKRPEMVEAGQYLCALCAEGEVGRDITSRSIANMNEDHGIHVAINRAANMILEAVLARDSLATDHDKLRELARAVVDEIAKAKRVISTHAVGEVYFGELIRASDALRAHLDATEKEV